MVPITPLRLVPIQRYRQIELSVAGEKMKAKKLVLNTK